MVKIAFLGPWDVLSAPKRTAFINACAPVNGFNLYEVDGNCLRFDHENPLISWSGSIMDSSAVSDLEDLGTSLRAGGVNELAVFRFPSKFAWADPTEALGFWQPLLPVKATRILFTPIDMNYIYVQLVSGHILYLDLHWDGEEVYDEALIKGIFLHIAEGHEVAR